MLTSKCRRTEPTTSVTVMNGSNKPKTSAFYNDNLLKLYRINGTEITPVTEARRRNESANSFRFNRRVCTSSTEQKAAQSGGLRQSMLMPPALIGAADLTLLRFRVGCFASPRNDGLDDHSHRIFLR